MQITLSSIFVEDQDRACRFYTDVLGFEKKHDIPMGEFRWLTVTSPEGASGVELVLEPADVAHRQIKLNSSDRRLDRFPRGHQGQPAVVTNTWQTSW